jgi:uncharacterized protein YndB with AHSA1/START domain
MPNHTLKLTTPSDREVAMIRTFDAGRAQVFDAFTRPELVKQWLGVRRGWTLPVCEIDLRPGGAYRYVWRGPDREEMAVGGVFKEITAPERLVCTERFDHPWYEGEALNTTTFVEQGGKTTVTMTLRYQSKEVRDAVVRSPMESGVAESFDLLEQQLAGGASPRPASAS